jgi:hypothetical protein
MTMEDRQSRPRVRPEAMERLRRGFEVRVERRRREQAPRMAEGQRLASEQDLGGLRDVFRLHHTAWWWGPAFILLFLFLVFGGVGLGELSRTPLERAGVLVIEGGGWVLLVVLLFSDPGRDEWIYCCDAGLVHVERRGPGPRVIRWTRVAAIYRAWVRAYHPGISEDNWYSLPAGHVLALEDGTRLSLAGGFENALDPWASPMRGRFEALRPVGEALPRFPTLGDSLERAVTGLFLPPAMAAYERGEVVWFGPVGLDRRGFTVAPGRESLPWSEFGGLAQAGRELVVVKVAPGGRQPGPPPRPGVLGDAVHNLRVLLPNLDLVLPPGRRGTAPGSAWQVLDAGSIPNLCVLAAMVGRVEVGTP